MKQNSHPHGLLSRMRQIKDLSPSERHIVDFIFSNLQEVSNMGIVELGDRSYTSTTTVKRLCHKLGIESYTDFRVALSAEISNYMRMNILEGAQAPIGRYDTTYDIINKVSDQNAKSIIDTSAMNHPDTIGEIINLMRNASRIDFYGVGPSNVVAVDARIKCMRLGIASSSFSDRSTMILNARNTPIDALAFLISYTGETDDVIEVANLLDANNVTTVSLTSMHASPLSQACKFNLYVQASEAWDRLGGMSSRICILNLIDVIFTALINTDYDRYMEIMKYTNVPNHRKDIHD